MKDMENLFKFYRNNNNHNTYNKISYKRQLIKYIIIMKELI